MPPGKRSEPDPERPPAPPKSNPMDLFHHPPSPSDYRLAGDGLRLASLPFDFVCHAAAARRLRRRHPSPESSPPDRGDTTRSARARLLRVEHAPNSERAKMERARDSRGGRAPPRRAPRLRPDRFDRSRPASAFATRFTATSLRFGPSRSRGRRRTRGGGAQARDDSRAPHGPVPQKHSRRDSPRSALISAGFSPRTGWIRTSPAAHGAPRGGGERAAKTGGRTRGS